jgi:putative ABC transport system ATP-binding protein
MSWWKRRPSPAESAPAGDYPLIRLEGITKTFRGDADEETRALDAVTVDIDRGEYVSVSGPSGCGKSTFLSIVAVVGAPSRGR